MQAKLGCIYVYYYHNPLLHPYSCPQLLQVNLLRKESIIYGTLSLIQRPLHLIQDIYRKLYFILVYNNNLFQEK